MSSKLVRLTLEAPAEIPDETRAIAETKALEAAVLALWEAGQISSSRAAQELDLGIHDFLDLLAAKGLPVVRADLNQNATEEASETLASGR